jgi:hypothetical protein
MGAEGEGTSPRAIGKGSRPRLPLWRLFVGSVRLDPKRAKSRQIAIMPSAERGQFVLVLSER